MTHDMKQPHEHQTDQSVLSTEKTFQSLILHCYSMDIYILMTINYS